MLETRCIVVLLAAVGLAACSSTGNQSDADQTQTPLANVGLVNADFNAEVHPFYGWDKGVHANPDSYRFEVRTGSECLSSPCAAILQQGTEPWGGLFQRVEVAGTGLRHARFSAALRGIDSDSPTHLQALVKRPGRPDDIHELKVDLLPIFKPATLEIPLPEDSLSVEVAVVHHGEGGVVVDEVNLTFEAP